MDLGLRNLRALVTGASKGLGYATALGLAREGVRLAINSRDEKALNAAAERISAETKAEAHALPGDLAEPDLPAKLVARASKALGGLDLLVTNTGGPPPGPFESFDDDAWDQALDLVFHSHLRLIRAALPHLRASEAASVLTVTSISVKQPVPNLVLSNAGRAATVGLTKTLALGLAREGVRLAINSRDEKALNAAAERISAETKSEAHALPGDLAEPDLPAKLVARAVEALGGLDLLVTNTGGPPPGSFESFDDDAWDHALDLVFRSHLRLMRAALPHLRASDAASVLTITSISVKQPVPNLVLSNAGRAATVGLTKTLALELGPEGIRFNSILPTWTETQRIYELLEERAKDKGTSVEEEIAAQSQASPLGRMGTPEEFANAAVFLLSPAASYITGVMLTVDGGMYKGTL